MWYLIAAAVLLAVSGAFGVSRVRGGGPARFGIVEKIMDSATLSGLTMEQVNGLLARLNLQDAPEPVMGAMCYEAMAYPSVAEYVCPVCGEKTVYEDMWTGFVEWELQGCRRIVRDLDELTEFRVELDETAFCSFCSPGGSDEPVLRLRIVSTDSTETVNEVSIHDLWLLESFLQGRLYYLTENDSQLPLKEYAGRIAELLGVPGTE